jgi:hypothetical protein
LQLPPTVRWASATATAADATAAAGSGRAGAGSTAAPEVAEAKRMVAAEVRRKDCGAVDSEWTAGLHVLHGLRAPVPVCCLQHRRHVALVTLTVHLWQ